MKAESDRSEQPAPMLRIYCDFDGTATPVDVGDEFFPRFAGPEALEVNRLYRDGSISGREAFSRYADMLEGVDEESIELFSIGYSLRPSFIPFVEWAGRAGISLMILSDGLDAYIEPILRDSGVSIPVRTNQLKIRKDSACRIVHPYSDENCAACGTCKRNVMLCGAADRDIIVLIGDGMSDFCPAGYADIVFATGELVDYCRRQNISYRRFETFDDVRRDLCGMLQRGKMRRPRQALQARELVWRSG